MTDWAGPWLPTASAAKYLGLTIPEFKALAGDSFVLLEARRRYRRCRHAYAYPVGALDAAKSAARRLLH